MLTLEIGRRVARRPELQCGDALHVLERGAVRAQVHRHEAALVQLRYAETGVEQRVRRPARLAQRLRRVVALADLVDAEARERDLRVDAARGELGGREAERGDREREQPRLLELGDAAAHRAQLARREAVAEQLGGARARRAAARAQREVLGGDDGRDALDKRLVIIIPLDVVRERRALVVVEPLPQHLGGRRLDVGAGAGALERGAHLEAAHVAHVDEQLAPLRDDLLERRRAEVEREADLGDEHGALGAQRAHLARRQRREEHLALVRELREPPDVGAARHEPLPQLKRDGGAAALAGVVERHRAVGARRHEGEVDAAAHAVLVALAQRRGEAAPGDAAVDVRGDRQLGELDDGRVERVQRRRVTVAAAELLEALHEEGQLRLQPTKHAIVLDEQRPGIETHRDRLLLDHRWRVGRAQSRVVRLERRRELVERQRRARPRARGQRARFGGVAAFELEVAVEVGVGAQPREALVAARLDDEAPLDARARRDQVVVDGERRRRVGARAVLRLHLGAHARRRRAHHRLEPAEEGGERAKLDLEAARLDKLAVQLDRRRRVGVCERGERRRQHVRQLVERVVRAQRVEQRVPPRRAERAEPRQLRLGLGRALRRRVSLRREWTGAVGRPRATDDRGGERLGHALLLEPRRGRPIVVGLAVAVKIGEGRRGRVVGGRRKRRAAAPPLPLQPRRGPLLHPMHQLHETGCGLHASEVGVRRAAPGRAHPRPHNGGERRVLVEPLRGGGGV